MGLDMYLTAKKYLSEYAAGDEKEVAETIGALPYQMFKAGMRVKEISFEAMYWRKANAIHKWFVDKCQDGVDQCQETYVDLTRLRELVDTCKIVLADNEKAGDLLPPAAGFFFGSTEVDEYYLGDLQSTVETLERILGTEGVEQFDFYYQSSW
jgi:hypothetical protein